MSEDDDDRREALVRQTAAENELMWQHVPATERPGLDEPIEYARDSGGHLMIRYSRPGTDVVETFCLAGWSDPEGIAVYRIRRWSASGNEQVEAWRSGQPLGFALLEEIDPTLN